MTEPRSAALLAIDWGTTSARAYRMDAGGNILEVRTAPLGIQKVRHGDFAGALDALLDSWRSESVPRIACGMIGSRQGWVEAPYVACPLSLADLGGELEATPAGELAIVPGARCVDAAGVPDVMRGEETQLAGAVAPGAGRVVAVLPGTHSKWAIVERGRLIEFATFMTGELYAALLGHTILGRLAEAPGASLREKAFARGVARGLRGDGLTHVMFGARTLALLGELEGADVADWLSGALLGYEIGAAREWAARRGDALSRVTVIAGDALALRYVAALSHAGLDAVAAVSDAAAHGLFQIARRAGLVD